MPILPHLSSRPTEVFPHPLVDKWHPNPPQLFVGLFRGDVIFQTGLIKFHGLLTKFDLLQVNHTVKVKDPPETEDYCMSP